MLISHLNTFFLFKIEHFHLIFKNTLELQTSRYNNFEIIIFLFKWPLPKYNLFTQIMSFVFLSFGWGFFGPFEVPPHQIYSYL